eukprot:2363375-Rhodomonas_salina.3
MAEARGKTHASALLAFVTVSVICHVSFVIVVVVSVIVALVFVFVFATLSSSSCPPTPATTRTPSTPTSSTASGPLARRTHTSWTRESTHGQEEHRHAIVEAVGRVLEHRPCDVARPPIARHALEHLPK